MFFRWFFSSTFRLKFHAYFFHIQIDQICCMSSPSQPLRFHYLNNIWWRVRIIIRFLLKSRRTIYKRYMFIFVRVGIPLFNNVPQWRCSENSNVRSPCFWDTLQPRLVLGLFYFVIEVVRFIVLFRWVPIQCKVRYAHTYTGIYISKIIIIVVTRIVKC